jgi:guanylate kinase
MRDGELDGYDYYFIDDETFDLMKSGGEFLETVEFCGRKYGSTYAEADKRTGSGRNAFVILEPHGVEQWKLNYTAPMLHISVKAPSIEELTMRMKLQGRSEENIQKRLAHDAPVFDVDPACYHLVVVNDDLEQACNTIREFVVSQLSSFSPP